jgi:hypothetical protein
MKCYEYQDLILQYDMLNDKEQKQLQQHMQTCTDCQSYYERFLKMSEALDMIAIEEGLDDSSNIPTNKHKKRTLRFGWKQLLLAASIFLLVGIGFSVTTTGQASIQKALHLLLAEKAENNNNPLPEVNGKQKVLYTVVESEDGTIIKSYTTGDKSRIEDESGNYDIIVGKKIVSYYKKENVFIIDELMYEYGEYEAKLFESMDDSKIQYLGTDSLFDRPVEKYRVEIEEGRFDELWFDRKYEQLLKSFTIDNGKKINESKVLELKEIELDVDSKLFDLTPPKGAKVMNRDEYELELQSNQ